MAGEAGPSRAADPAAIRQAIRQARQERPQRCRSDQRRRLAALDRFGAGQVGRGAGGGDAAVGARTAGAPAHAVGQRLARPCHRAGHGRPHRQQGPDLPARRGGHRRRGAGSTGGQAGAEAAGAGDRPDRGEPGRNRRQAEAAIRHRHAGPQAGPRAGYRADHRLEPLAAGRCGAASRRVGFSPPSQATTARRCRPVRDPRSPDRLDTARA